MLLRQRVQHPRERRLGLARVRRRHVDGIGLHAAEEVGPQVLGAVARVVDGALAELDRRHVPPVGVAGGLGLRRRALGGQLTPANLGGERRDVAGGQRGGLRVVHPVVALLRLLVVAAEGDVVDGGLAGKRSVVARDGREAGAGCVGNAGRQPDAPRARNGERRARDRDHERAGGEVDMCSAQRPARAGGDVDQPRALRRHEDRGVDPRRRDARARGPRAPAGGGRVVGVEGALGDRHVGVGERVPVDAPPAGVGREADRGAEDVGAVHLGVVGRVGVGAGAGGEAGDGEVDRLALGPVVVVEEVAPLEGAAGDADGARRARERVGERPARGHRQRGLGLQRRGRHAVGHARRERGRGRGSRSPHVGRDHGHGRGHGQHGEGAQGANGPPRHT